MKFKPTKGNDKCPCCGEPITPVEGAVSYHMPCLLKEMAHLREPKEDSDASDIRG